LTAHCHSLGNEALSQIHTTNRATRIANSGLSLTTLSARIVKSARCSLRFRKGKDRPIHFRTIELHHVEYEGLRFVPILGMV
jgi:hypothetical protein